MELNDVLSGRMRRRKYLYFSLFSVLSILFFLVFQLAITAMYPEDRSSGVAALLDLCRFLIAYGALLLGTSLALANIVFTVRRLHDFGYSGLWALGVVALSLLSLVSTTFSLLLIGIQILLISLPGNRGPNHYGPDPRSERDSKGHVDFA